MTSLQLFEKLISIQKLYDKVYFEKIKKYNIDNIDEWKDHYPSHREWIKKACQDLIDGNRIAFGVFNSLSKKNELFGSVLLKKSNYTPELELKNLIIFDTDLYEEFNDLSKEDLISYSNFIAVKLLGKVIAYAGFRGYKRISVELLQKSFSLKSFIDAGFTISGTKTPKYFDKDEIIYLNYEVNSIYRLDPYDNTGAAKWILNRLLGATDFDNSNRDVILNGKITNAECYTFYNGEKHKDIVLSKFNVRNKILIVPENFEWSFSESGIDVIKFNEEKVSIFFIFDFTERNIGKKIGDIVNSQTIVLKKEEIFKLLGADFRSRYRFPNKDISGLILISDPNKFPLKKALEVKDFFTYIKLGNYGQYLIEGMTILFAHFSYEESENFKIWGAAKLYSLPVPVDINEKRAELKQIASHEEVSAMSDADILWFDEYDDGPENNFFKPLWEKDKFLIHNAYNETNNVVLFNLKEFEDLAESSVFVKDVIGDRIIVESLKNEFDEAYLSEAEVTEFTSKLSKIKFSVASSPTPNRSNETRFVRNPFK